MITISLCVIVRNEESVLGRMLDSAASIVDEIILVDTGSTDSTKEIALSRGCRVFDFPWCDDFSAARNFACSKASMEYWMWLDADDVIPPKSQKELLDLKKQLSPSVDMIFLLYVTAFDQNGAPSFSYFRERLIRNYRGYLWHGQVHEAIAPEGTVLSLSIPIEHRKEQPGDPNRNLRIYETILRGGQKLDTRQLYYYGRELFGHQRFREAASVFRSFLKKADGWKENQIDACLLLSRCMERLGKANGVLPALFASFRYDAPRASTCCEIGRCKFASGLYQEAAWWYKAALSDQPELHPGAFIQTAYYDYIPLLQLCLCHSRLGDHKTALSYHEKAKALWPNDEAVQHNELYFQELSSSAPDLFKEHIVQ